MYLASMMAMSAKEKASLFFKGFYESMNVFYYINAHEEIHEFVDICINMKRNHEPYGLGNIKLEEGFYDSVKRSAK